MALSWIASASSTALFFWVPPAVSCLVHQFLFCFSPGPAAHSRHLYRAAELAPPHCELPRLIKGICSHSQVGSNKAPPTCLDADPFACPQPYLVDSPLMEEDMYLDIFLDPYTIQVSLAATLLRTRAGVGLGDLFEMPNRKRQALLSRLFS